MSIVVALHTATRRSCSASSNSLAVRYRCLASAAGLVPISSAWPTTCSAGPSKPRTTRTSTRILRQVRLRPVGDACRSFARHVPRNPYPYPLHSNPTPHQIFHLPKSATKEDVKARYYDLVRIYHPDSPINHSVTPSVAQARFQAISAAYDVLRGKASALHHFADPSGTLSEDERKRNEFRNLSTAMWKARQRKRADFLNLGTGRTGWVDDKWKDRFMFGLIFLTIAAFVAQTYTTRARAIASSSANSAANRHQESPSSSPSSSSQSYRNGISRPPFKMFPSSSGSSSVPPHEPGLAAPSASPSPSVPITSTEPSRAEKYESGSGNS